MTQALSSVPSLEGCFSLSYCPFGSLLVVWRHLKLSIPGFHSSLRHNETEEQNSQLCSMPGKPVLSMILMGHALVVVCQLSSCGTWREVLVLQPRSGRSGPQMVLLEWYQVD